MKVKNNRVEELLKRPLTVQEEEERRAQCFQLNRHLDEVQLLLKEKSSEVKDLKDDIETTINTIRNTLGVLDRGWIHDKVACEEEWDYINDRYTMIRLETGEVVKARPLRADERQPDLPGLN